MTLTVLHSTKSWLAQTQTWLYNQVRFLPSDINSLIICEQTRNLDQFLIPHIHCMADDAWWRHALAERFPKLRSYLHSGFLLKVVRKCNAQVLHSHFGNRAWRNMRVARKSELKHIVTFYGRDVNRLPSVDPQWYQRYQALFGQAKCVLCEGPYMAQSIIDMGCPAHKVKVHHLGVMVDEIPFKPRVWDPDEPLRMLIAASFREKKGIPYGLEALGQLQHEVPIEITIIGDAPRGNIIQEENRKILTALERHKLATKTRMLGFQPYDRLFEEAYKHHIFLSPSVTASDGDTEGGAPVMIIEMVTTGMPVVSTSHCDIPEVVQPGLRHLLAPERDVEGLVHCLKWLIDHRAQWADILKVGREYVEAEFNARVQGERLGEIYRAVSNGDTG